MTVSGSLCHYSSGCNWASINGLKIRLSPTSKPPSGQMSSSSSERKSMRIWWSGFREDLGLCQSCLRKPWASARSRTTGSRMRKRGWSCKRYSTSARVLQLPIKTDVGETSTDYWILATASVAPGASKAFSRSFIVGGSSSRLSRNSGDTKRPATPL